MTAHHWNPALRSHDMLPGLHAWKLLPSPTLHGRQLPVFPVMAIMLLALGIVLVQFEEGGYGYSIDTGYPLEEQIKAMTETSCEVFDRDLLRIWNAALAAGVQNCGDSWISRFDPSRPRDAADDRWVTERMQDLHYGMWHAPDGSDGSLLVAGEEALLNGDTIEERRLKVRRADQSTR